MAEFTKISDNFKELSSRAETSKKLSLTNKELNKIKSDLRYLYNADLSYNLIEKSKIGKSLSMCIETLSNCKISKQLKLIKEQMERVKMKLHYFIRNYFFDENIPSDSDTSSYNNFSEKGSKRSRINKNGLNMLMRANQKMDLCEQSNYSK